MTSFLYIDESKINLERDVDLYSLSALRVPSEIYSDLRQSLYEALHPFFDEIEDTISPIPELHYRDFLPDKDDQFKIDVLNAIVQQLINYEVSIFRVGYYGTKETVKLISSDKKDEFFYQLCWFGIQSVTSNTRNNCLMIPVVDAGFEKSFQLRVNGFGHSQKFCDQSPESLRSSISIPHHDNIAEISYVDSNFSIFSQIIDCISGMRNETLRKNKGKTLSSYKSKIHEISELLDQNALIAHEEHVVLNQK